MQNIYMLTEILFQLQNPIKSKQEFIDNISILGMGGYAFEIDNKIIPFDFESWNGDSHMVSDHKILLKTKTGNGGFIQCDTIDIETYADAYKKLNINPENITAATLASVTRIDEFNIAIETAPDWNNKIQSITLKDITFTDGTKNHNVTENVLKQYEVTSCK